MLGKGAAQCSHRRRCDIGSALLVDLLGSFPETRRPPGFHGVGVLWSISLRLTEENSACFTIFITSAVQLRIFWITETHLETFWNVVKSIRRRGS